MRLTLQLLAAAFALMFLVAALGKIDAWRSWSITISHFFPVGHPLNLAVRLGVPIVELGLSVYVLIRPSDAFIVVGVVMIAFAIAVQAASRKHPGVPCNCFGSVAPSTLDYRLISRNLGSAFIAFLASVQSFSVGVSALPKLSFLLIAWAGGLAVLSTEFVRLRRSSVSWPRVREVKHD